MTDADIAYQLDALASPDGRARANALRAIAAAAAPDRPLLEACERLLGDRTLAVLSVPYSFGEVRWLAADAVAALRGALGIAEPVSLDDVVPPQTATDVARLAEAAGLPLRPGVDGALATLEELAKLGRLPRRRLVRSPGS